MQNRKLAEKWEAVANDLGIKVIYPYCLSLGDLQLTDLILVVGFGGKKGTILTNDYKTIKAYRKLIIEDGYGFSVFSDPKKEYSSFTDKDTYIKILNEWEWTGLEKEKPLWVN